MEKKKYKIAELANILDVSVPAIRKKVTVEGNQKRYKKQFEVISEDDTMFILLDDIELEKEKELAFRNKNKFSVKKTLSDTQIETFDDNDIIDVTPERPVIIENQNNILLEFTKRYTDEISNVNKTLRETYEKHSAELLEKEQKILLLTTSENSKDNEINALRANEKTLQAQKKRYQLCIIALSVTFFIIVITLVYFLVKAQNKPPQIITTEKVVEKVVNVPVKVKKR